VSDLRVMILDVPRLGLVWQERCAVRGRYCLMELPHLFCWSRLLTFGQVGGRDGIVLLMCVLRNVSRVMARVVMLISMNIICRSSQVLLHHLRTGGSVRRWLRFLGHLSGLDKRRQLVVRVSVRCSTCFASIRLMLLAVIATLALYSLL